MSAAAAAELGRLSRLQTMSFVLSLGREVLAACWPARVPAPHPTTATCEQEHHPFLSCGNQAQRGCGAAQGHTASTRQSRTCSRGPAGMVLFLVQGMWGGATSAPSKDMPPPAWSRWTRTGGLERESRGPRSPELS